MGLMARTLPFLLLRLAVYAGVALAFLILTTIGAGMGWAIGSLGDEGFRAGSTFLGGLIGFSIVGGFAWFARAYLLYLVKGAHIAVLVELIDGKDIPGGKGQITYGREVVQARFAQSSVLFGLDLLIKGVIRAVTGLARGMLRVLPIPGAKPLAGALNAFLKVAVGFLDEVILAYAIRTGSTNAWGSARTALILYGQNWKPMMKNAAWLALFIYLLSFVIFLVMLLPASLFVWLMPGNAAIVGLVFALILAWAVKAALLEPLAVTCMMQVYFKTIEGQVPDPEWERRLASMSGQFRKLTDKAFSGSQEPQADGGQPPSSPPQEQGAAP